MCARLKFASETDSFDADKSAVIDVEEFSFEIVTLFVNFLYSGKVDCDGISVRLELARMGQYYDVSVLQKLMFLEIEMEWAEGTQTPLSVAYFHRAGFDLTSLLRVSDLSDGHLHYLKAVGFGVQDFLVHGDSLPVSQRFSFCFAVDRVFENNPTYTFAALKKATQQTEDIVDVLRQLPSDQIRLIDEAALAQSVRPPDLCQLGILHLPED